MKKTVLALLFPALMSAQGVQITAVTPTVLCPGDSVHITVTFAPGSSTQIKLTGPGNGMNWGYDSTHIATNWEKSFNGTDTVFTFHTIVPANVTPGMLSLYTVSHSGNVITIDATCGTVGIKEYGPRHVTSPEYYDLSGNRVFDLKPGVILVEQHGSTRRKVLLLE